MRYLTGPLLLFTFASCEGYFHLEGKALDNNSGLPVSDARFTFVVEEKDTTPLRCNIIERDSIRAEERIKLRKKNITDSFTGRDQTGFYKYCDTLVHADGSFNQGSRLFNVMTGFPTAQLILSSKGFHSQALTINNPHTKGLVIRLVKN